MKNRHEVLSRITAEPGICGGRACIKGHRIWVSLILDMLSEGMSYEDILQEYPQLEKEDIRACIAYAAEISREKSLELSV